jgi:hypothetical protein
MTPKEKAIELVSKYYGHFTAHMSIAKKCALIAVDEMIEVAKSLTMETQEWYEEVKIEIEKL